MKFLSMFLVLFLSSNANSYAAVEIIYPHGQDAQTIASKFGSLGFSYLQSAQDYLNILAENSECKIGSNEKLLSVSYKIEEDSAKEEIIYYNYIFQFEKVLITFERIDGLSSNNEFAFHTCR